MRDVEYPSPKKHVVQQETRWQRGWVEGGIRGSEGEGAERGDRVEGRREMMGGRGRTGKASHATVARFHVMHKLAIQLKPMVAYAFPCFWILVSLLEPF